MYLPLQIPSVFFSEFLVCDQKKRSTREERLLLIVGLGEWVVSSTRIIQYRSGMQRETQRGEGHQAQLAHSELQWESLCLDLLRWCVRSQARQEHPLAPGACVARHIQDSTAASRWGATDDQLTIAGRYRDGQLTSTPLIPRHYGESVSKPRPLCRFLARPSRAVSGTRQEGIVLQHAMEEIKKHISKTRRVGTLMPMLKRKRQTPHPYYIGFDFAKL